ncbi:hypothetical protein GOODEAATRI_029545, partial [Goodea atripinnis]
DTDAAVWFWLNLVLLHLGIEVMLNSKVLQEMRNLLTTQSQNFYKEQVQKQVLTRLAWKSRYAKLYPSSYNSLEPTKLPQLSKDTQ